MTNDIKTIRNSVERPAAEFFVHAQIISALQKLGAPIDIARRAADYGADHYDRTHNVADALLQAGKFAERIHAGFKFRK